MTVFLRSTSRLSSFRSAQLLTVIAGTGIAVGIAQTGKTISSPHDDDLEADSTNTNPRRKDIWGSLKTILFKPAVQCDSSLTPAEEEFLKSSSFNPPTGWKEPLFKIRNDYPLSRPPVPSSSSNAISSKILPLPLPGSGASPNDSDAPWLDIDFRKEPQRYAEMIKEYCWEGNLEVDWVVQNNQVRNWYHAPWMHLSVNGREPLHGLTFERATPPLEFASTQTNALQSWAIGFYNAAGASVFGEAWRDPNNPVWDRNLDFPVGSATFKILMSTASDDQVPTMKGSPGWQAVIAKQSDPKKAPYNGKDRNAFPSMVRLIQMDWAVRDTRAPIGWVFGTFVYDGTSNEKDPWNKIIPVGIQWGNDPQLDQASYEKGERPQQTWLNPEAEALRKSLGGKRPSWGWNDRLNGPADNFISSCASCHSVAQRPEVSLVPPTPKYDPITRKWTPEDDSKTMHWFRNIPAGQPFEQGGISADYSLQFKMGFENYQTWRNNHHLLALPPGRRFPLHLLVTAREESTMRTGPIMEYDESM